MILDFANLYSEESSLEYCITLEKYLLEDV